MWEHNGSDDSTRAIRGRFYEDKSLKDMLALMFRGGGSTSPRSHGLTDSPPRARLSSKFMLLHFL